MPRRRPASSPVTDGGLPGDGGSRRGLGGDGEPDRAGGQAGASRAVQPGLVRRRPARPQRTAATLANAAARNAVLRALAAAGCPLIEVHEPAATAIGADPAERALFREAHLRLLDGVDGTHLSLAITGGSADAAGIDTILAAPYASLAVDLIAGPDNWRLVVATHPASIGIVCGALSPAADGDDGPEVLLWAAAYAASTGARGPDRVGLATASSLAGLPWPDAIRKLERLGAAARLRGAPASEAVASPRPARREQPGGRARIRRTGPVPRPASGSTIRLDSTALRCHHPTTSLTPKKPAVVEAVRAPRTRPRVRGSVPVRAAGGSGP